MISPNDRRYVRLSIPFSPNRYLSRHFFGLFYSYFSKEYPCEYMPCRKLEEESNLCTSFMVQPPFPCQPSLSYHTSLLSTLFSSSHFNTQYLFPSKLSLTFQKFLLFLLTCLEQNFQVPGGVQLHKNPMLNYYPGVRDYMGFYRCSRNKECHMNYCVS